MFWVVQNNLWNEMNFMNMIDCLVRLEIPHEIIKVIPFINEIAGENNEPNYTWSPPAGIPTFVCGGTTLVKIAQKKGWMPGVFLNENFDNRVQLEKWGYHMLNHDSVVRQFGDIPTSILPEQFFIRPVLDDKSFSGHVSTLDKLRIWQKKVIKLRDVYTSLDENTLVSIASVKQIHKEHRFFIVDGKIATYSTYKLGDRVVKRNDFLTVELTNFVNARIAEWQPDRAFVIDIAETASDFKIIEVNCINSSGFYACDVMKLVIAIEKMKWETHATIQRPVE